MTNKTEEKPKSFYFTLYLLSQFIETKQADRRKNDPDRGGNLTKDAQLYDNDQENTSGVGF